MAIVANWRQLVFIDIAMMRAFPVCFAVATLVVAGPALALHIGSLRHASVQRSHAELGDWRLDIARNDFTGEQACRLRAKNGRAVFMAGAIGFRFNSQWDVTGAAYRFNSGPDHYTRDDLPQLMASGVPYDRGGMANSGAGYVWIPYARLAEFNNVWIQPRRDRTPRNIHFRGLKGLYDIAVSRGCTPDSRFVER